VESVLAGGGGLAADHAEATPATVTCLGDSITAGFPYEGSGDTYPARLAELLEATYGADAYRVINRGVTGYRADQVLDDLRTHGWMAQDNPAVVLLMVGGNDLLQEILTSGANREQVIARTTAEVQGIIDEVVAHTNPNGGHPGVIASAFPPNLLIGTYGSQTVALFNERLQANLTRYSLLIDTNWSDLYDPAMGMARAALMSDPVHPNTAGYAVIAQNWFEAISRLRSLTRRTYLPVVLRGA